MLRLDRLAKHCANIQLPYLGAHISSARRCLLVSANKRLVANTPEDRLEQALRAMEALGNSQPQQQGVSTAAVKEQDIQDVMQKTKSKRKHKRDCTLDAAQQEAIRQKIAASMARKAAKAKFNCPACGVTLTRAENVLSHMARCCEDLLQPEVLQQVDSIQDSSRLHELLSEAAALESRKRRQALEITFLSSNTALTPAARQGASSSTGTPQQQQHSDLALSSAAAATTTADVGGSSSSDFDDEEDAAAGDEDDSSYEGGYSKHTRQRIQQSPADIAQQMGLSIPRAERLLRQAMRTVPIAVDTSSRLDVVYEDCDFIAVNKPVGYHTAPIHRWQGGSMVNMLLGHLQKSAADRHQQPAQQQQQPSQQQQPQVPSHQAHAKPYVLHRLDYNTSGLLLFGKRREVVPGVSAQFRERRVSKSYLAITIGVPGQQSFTVDAPIDRHPQHDTARCIAATGKPAVTDVEVISANPDFDFRSCSTFAEGELFHERGGVLGSAARASGSFRGVALVQCFPRSGRTHQIRLHMAHVGHPLIGDEVYGVTGDWISRQALHARSLQLAHPLSGELMSFVAPLHDDFKQALQMLGLQLPEGE